MVERNGPLGGLGGRNEQLCCVSVNKIFDSARDKDCLEDVRVHLCDHAQEVIDRASAVRCRNVEVINTTISVETVPFNRGYYQVTIRYFFCVTLEACLCNGRTQEVQGLCVFDKKIILFGSEKNVSVFVSDPNNNGFCTQPKELKCDSRANLPTVVVEVATPIALDTKVIERCRPYGHCCINTEAIPEGISNRFGGNFCDGVGVNAVYVTIGVFSVIRMEREVQLILPACHFSLPEKESRTNDCTDPCGVFGKMSFPMCEFFPFAEDTSLPSRNENKGCCK